MSHAYTAPDGEFSVTENPDGSITVMTPYAVETLEGVTIRDHPLFVRGAVVGAIARMIIDNHEKNHQD